MQQKYDIKSTMLGPEQHMEQEMRVLSRVVQWDKEGIRHEADPRRAEIIQR